MPWFHQRPNLLTMYGSLTPLPFQRRFTPLAAAGSQYYDLNTPFVATGDFDIEWEDNVDDPTAQTIIAGKLSDTLDLVQYRSDGGIRIRLNSVTVTFAAASTVRNGSLIKRSINRIGDTFAYSENGVVIDTIVSVAAGAETLTLETLGQINTSFFLTGYLANVSLQTAGDSRLYKLDENFGETSVAVDSIGGNNGTAINIAESQLFTEVADGWEGVNQSITSTPLLGDGSDPELIPVVISITQNQVYRVNATFDQVLTDTSDAGWITNRGIPSTSPWRKIPVIGESVGGDFTCTSTGPLEVYGRAAATISYKNVSVKEFLEVA